MLESIVESAMEMAPRSDLTVEQERAIMIILTGATDAAVAEEVGVVRETVTRWRNDNPSFRYTLETVRRQTFQAMRDRLQVLAGKAIDVIEGHLEGKSLPAALAVLKACGFSDHSLVRQEMEDRERFLIKEEKAADFRAFRQAVMDCRPSTPQDEENQ